MKTHTLRGRIDASSKKRLIIDDGRFNHAMVVKEFYVWSINDTEDPSCVLALNDESVGTNMDASNGAQIAWARTVNAGGLADMWAIIDPDHVVVRDLFIHNFSAYNGNYLVILEAKSISDDEAILQLIKEGQQDV